MTVAEEINRARIEDFIGYGRRDAPVVFIGMEEGLGAGEDLTENLRRRSTYKQVVGLWEPRIALNPSFDPHKVGLQRTWRVMCDLMLRRNGERNPTLAQRRWYQATLLGGPSGETLLTELLPYPHNKTSDWRFDQYGWYASRADYEKDQLEKRIPLLSSVLSEQPRDLIVCYGKAHWNSYKRLFSGATWERIGPFEVSQHALGRIILTPHFSGYGFNSDAQLSHFAEVALQP